MLEQLTLYLERKFRVSRCSADETRRFHSLALVASALAQARRENWLVGGAASESWAGSANLLSSGYFSISVGGAGTRLPVCAPTIMAFSSSALTAALLSKWLLVMT